MKPGEALPLLSVLVHTELKEISWTGKDLNLGFHYLIGNPDGDKKIFLVLKDCTEFYYQPILNNALVYSQPEEILALHLRFEGVVATADGRIKIPTRAVNAPESGLLVFQCASVIVLNENFDELSPEKY